MRFYVVALMVGILLTLIGIAGPGGLLVIGVALSLLSAGSILYTFASNYDRR